MLMTASKVLLVGFAFLGLSSVATLMYSFMGGNAASPDAQAFIALQGYGIALGILMSILCLAYSISYAGWPGGIRSLWQHLPGWLVFAGGLMISLTLMGEIAWTVVRVRAAELIGSFNHVSLVCLGSSSLAFMVLFATVHRLRGHTEYSKSRW